MLWCNVGERAGTAQRLVVREREMGAMLWGWDGAGPVGDGMGGWIGCSLAQQLVGCGGGGMLVWRFRGVVV